MARFFITKDNISEDTVTITGKDAFHIARSLRMAVGDRLTVCAEDGKEYSCELTRIRDEECLCEITETKRSLSEPKSFITLYMAYPKGDKLETVIQKAVELGASRIVPFESSRCIKKPKADKAEEKTARLTRIADEAAKQCGRGALPTVSLPLSYNEMLKEASRAALPIFCYEGEGTRSLKDILDSFNEAPDSISVVVGSEGGFSPDEARAAEEIGFKMANLGPRILRCETAPDYALSAISYRFEL
jgi:16S rRNA (uracil1498-N3)-methyltransferase